jgi:hypothetical protein
MRALAVLALVGRVESAPDVRVGGKRVVVTGKHEAGTVDPA